ncbi:MAG: ABC transporter permease [Gemmatimonadetes bacterium]|nr:ABC transporter permease [Gemmatimonadota bacterium]
MLALNSIRELRHRPLRTLLTMAGVAVSTAMLADMLMLGGGIQESFGDLLESRGHELRLSPKGTLPFDTEATIPGFESLRDSIDRVPGVARIAPVLAMSVTAEVLDGDPEGGSGEAQTLALGMEPGDASLYRLVDGDLPGPGEVLTDAGLGERLGVGPGGRLRLSTASGLRAWGRSVTVRVSGTGDFVFATARDRPLTVPLSDLQALSALEDQVSFAMIRILEGEDPDSVRDRIAATVQRAEVVTLAGVTEKLDERLSYFTQLAVILGSVSLFVAALLIGTITAVSVSERLGIIAALRAIGVSRRRIVGDLTAESAILCAVGGGIGVALSLVVARYLESILATFPGLPAAVRFFVLRPESLATAFALVVASGAVAGLVPALNATRLEVTALLHREEP